MKTHRIVSLGHDSYVLPESFSTEDSLRLINFLAGCRKVSDTDYIPDAASRYATTVMVLRDQPVEVAMKITASRLMTQEEFNEARDKGQALYDAANTPRAVELSS